jgi:hypothetical protein
MLWMLDLSINQQGLTDVSHKGFEMHNLYYHHTLY